jgi:hypothetical protein
LQIESLDRSRKSNRATFASRFNFGIPDKQREWDGRTLRVMSIALNGPELSCDGVMSAPLCSDPSKTVDLAELLKSSYSVNA